MQAVLAGQTGLACNNIPPTKGESLMEILTRRSHKVLKRKDSRDPEGKNFHTAPNFGERNAISHFL